MARIRTIKPDLFKHEALFEAEAETGLPLRLAFVGLWTACDREGRFLWRPRSLKTDVLPYDEVDFSRVLDALLTRGFLVKYVSNGREIGAIPSWHRHQAINNRESASALPPPPENIEEFDASVTREPRVGRAASGEGKGREGKEEEPNGSLSETPLSDVRPKTSKKRTTYPADFEAAWQAYPRTPNMSKSEALPAWRKLSEEDRALVLPSIPSYRSYLATKPNLEVIHVARYLSKRRFEGFTVAELATSVTDADWSKRLDWARKNRQWSAAEWGAMPGAAGCNAPPSLLLPGDGVGWSEWSRRPQQLEKETQ